MWQSFANAAADHVVLQDFAAPREQRRLLREVDAETTDAASVRTQIRALYLAILGERVSDEDLDAAAGLFEQVQAAGGPEATTRAWRVLVSALLQDARFTHY